jgi:hypothetical protein
MPPSPQRLLDHPMSKTSELLNGVPDQSPYDIVLQDVVAQLETGGVPIETDQPTAKTNYGFIRGTSRRIESCYDLRNEPWGGRSEFSQF